MLCPIKLLRRERTRSAARKGLRASERRLNLAAFDALREAEDAVRPPSRTGLAAAEGGAP